MQEEEEEAEGMVEHRLQPQELWYLDGGGGETKTPSGEAQEDQLDQEKCAGLQEVKRSRKAIENQSSTEAFSVQLERIAGISSIFGQHLQRRSTPTEKETIKDLVRMIKREP